MLLINLGGCEKLDLEVSVPNCIENKIKEFKNSPLACDSEAKVYRCDFQNVQVYVFQPGYCGSDLPIKIYDNKCNLICTLGGLEGNFLCSGMNFYENSTNPILVWKNE